MHFRPALLLLIAALLSGCNQPAAVDLLETYASRTSNAIEVDFDLDLRPASELYPALAERRARIAEIPEVRQGLLEFLELRHCDLMQLISERNSNLGKLATPSQRLIYELRVLPALNRCIDSISDDSDLTELRARLIEVRDQKQSGLPAQLFNSFYTVPEMEQQFSLGGTPLDPDLDTQEWPALTALAAFESIVRTTQDERWETPAYAEQLEEQYERLYRSTFGADWLASFALLTQTLDQTADAIGQKLAGRPICFNGRPNNQSKIMWNVFMQFYVGSLQPYLAKVDRQAQEWRRLNASILEQLNPYVGNTELLTPYFDLSGPVWKPYLDARDRHTRAWQALLEQCGLRPGNPAS